MTHDAEDEADGHEGAVHSDEQEHHDDGVGAHDEDADHHDDGAIAGLADPDGSFSEASSETTSDENHRSVGGRIGFLPIPNLELGASFLSGREQGSGDRFNLVGLDAWYSLRGLQLRAEYVALSSDAPDAWGYYAQAAYRLRHRIPQTTGLLGVVSRLEPVIRWGEVRGSGAREHKQLALGLNYWLYPSVPLKLTYELNDGSVDGGRFIAQLAYGF